MAARLRRRPWSRRRRPALATGAGRIAAAVEGMRFHAAIGTLRELAARAAPAEASTIVRLLAPFAPYLAEELWAKSGGGYSVHGRPWPDTAAATPAPVGTLELVVQVDGRVRDRLSVPAGLGAADAVARARRAPNVARRLGDRPVVGWVHVPDRLVNLVTKG